jgi:sugar lactone lactonase YvrE
MALLRWNTTGITIGGYLNPTNITSNSLNNPKGIVLDSTDTLYVSDTNNHRIQHIFVGYTNDTTIAGNASGSAGSTPSYLDFPNDIAIDSYDNLYVADSFNHRIQLWRVNASSGTTIAGGGK